MHDDGPPGRAPMRADLRDGASPGSHADERRPHRGGEPGEPFTQTVDGRLGIVRPRGHLTADTGALLTETVEALHRSGHPRIRLDLGGLLSADDAGLDTLCALQRWVTSRGRSLVLLGRVERASA
ncbi:STAS domain-containing protein [Blastococcus brunescens]|uniref:STAS domain-containing protein n=1 Tax=Blastococcus brunescens TaxID=1564165 RepID=A0ABZ1BAV4_9ACTN|nr:STAS domain-containing protein [Blastococcus sp. BMG 8361]WRL66370.1 STAS domain-containing protein [Blastococcus sp. BMG 8361]